MADDPSMSDAPSAGAHTHQPRRDETGEPAPVLEYRSPFSGATRPRQRARRRVAIGAVVAAALLFAGTVGLLYYKGLHADVPTSAIHVEGSKAYDGAEVTIDGLGLAKPLRDTVREGNGFCPRFYVGQGMYRLTVNPAGKTRKEGITLEFPLADRQTRAFVLANLLDAPTTRPTSRPRP